MNVIINFNLMPLNQNIINNEETIHCNIFDFLSLFEEKILFALKNKEKITIILPNKENYFRFLTNHLETALLSYPDKRYKYFSYFKKDKYYTYTLNSKGMVEFILKELQNTFPNIHELRKVFCNIEFSCDYPETLKIINNFSLYLKRC